MQYATIDNNKQKKTESIRNAYGLSLLVFTSKNVRA